MAQLSDSLSEGGGAAAKSALPGRGVPEGAAAGHAGEGRADLKRAATKRAAAPSAQCALPGRGVPEGAAAGHAGVDRADLKRAATKRAAAPSAQCADWSGLPLTRDEFRALVRRRGDELYRDLAWRNIADAYAVLVSEVMLQQTQVARVEKFWPRWLSLFPTVDALAAADTATVLEAWQGLGYNRRALALKRACEICSAENAGALPRTVDELVKLPGIGPATAAGVVAFAYGEPAVYLETNVRSVFLHELFPHAEGVSDKTLMPYVADACPASDARGWYYALLDYGAHLKQQVANPSRRSAHYTRQSAFQGSRRQKRSFLLKRVLAAPEGVPAAQVAAELDETEAAAGRARVDAALFESLVGELVSEGFFHRKGDLLVP